MATDLVVRFVKRYSWGIFKSRLKYDIKFRTGSRRFIALAAAIRFHYASSVYGLSFDTV